MIQTDKSIRNWSLFCHFVTIYALRTLFLTKYLTEMDLVDIWEQEKMVFVGV